jgi:hypothetical protein
MPLPVEIIDDRYLLPPDSKKLTCFVSGDSETGQTISQWSITGEYLRHLALEYISDVSDLLNQI